MRVRDFCGFWVRIPVWSGHSCPRLLTLTSLVDWKLASPHLRSGTAAILGKGTGVQPRQEARNLDLSVLEKLLSDLLANQLASVHDQATGGGSAPSS